MSEFRFRHHRGCLALTVELLRLVADDPTGFGRKRRVAKGRALWRPSDAPDRMYLIESGRMRIYAIDEAGHELLLQLVQAGEPFGELCFCIEDGGVRRSTAIAARDSDVVEFPYVQLLARLRQRVDLLDAVLVTMCVRLSDCELRTEALAYRDAEQRIGRLLLMLATRPHQPARRTSDLVVTHSELATLAAMTRSHVTVVLNRFRKQGTIEYKRTGPITVDIARLAALLGRGARRAPTRRTRH